MERYADENELGFSKKTGQVRMRSFLLSCKRASCVALVCVLCPRPLSFASKELIRGWDTPRSELAGVYRLLERL